MSLTVRSLFLWLAAIVVFAVLFSPNSPKLPEPSTLYERTLARAERSELGREAVALMNAAGVANTFEAGRVLAIAGMRRLDGPTLVRRAMAIAEVLPVIDPTLCASYIEDVSSDSAALALVEAFDSVTIEWWWEMTFHATIAELKDFPLVIDVSDDDFEAVGEAIWAHRPEDELERMFAIIEDEAPDVQEACWAAERMFALVKDLPSVHAEMWARVLVSQ